MKSNSYPITRRESIKKILKFSGGIALASVPALPFNPPRSALAGNRQESFIVDATGRTPGYAIRDLTRKTFEAAGGIQQFISKGDVVVIKPNISWARAPQLAATTHPEVE